MTSYTPNWPSRSVYTPTLPSPEGAYTPKWEWVLR